ncbi:MAG: HlyD family secretion protein, partial [Pseudomonadota bacterium]
PTAEGSGRWLPVILLLVFFTVTLTFRSFFQAAIVILLIPFVANNNNCPSEANAWNHQPMEDASENMAQEPSGNVDRNPNQFRNIIAITLLIGCVIAFGFWVLERYRHVYVTDSRIAADIFALSSRISGWIQEIPVSTGSEVKKGDPVLIIDASEAKIQLAELEARLESLQARQITLKTRYDLVDEQTKTRLSSRRSELEAEEARLKSATAGLDLSRQELERSERLYKQLMVSQQKRDADRTRYQRSEQEQYSVLSDVNTAQADLLEATADRRQLEVLNAELNELGHQIKELQEQIERQKINIEYHTVRSPIDGVVDETFAHIGEYAIPGQRLIMLHDPDDLWIRANIKETEIRHVRVGAPVKVFVDAYPDEELAGTVDLIGDAATNQFAMMPNPNPSGNFTKITQRLKVNIELTEPSELLRPGMMVELKIVIPDRN